MRLINKIGLFFHSYHSYYEFEEKIEVIKTKSMFSPSITVKLCSTRLCEDFHVSIPKHLEIENKQILEIIKGAKNDLRNKKIEYYEDKRRRDWLAKQ